MIEQTQEDMNKELTQSHQGRDETIQGTPLCSYTYTRVESDKTHCEPFDLLTPEQWVLGQAPLICSE